MKSSHHRSKEYCTPHPLVAYFIDCDGNIQHNFLCFISDDNNLDTNFVYKIQTILVDYLKENLQILDKIFYFSGSCAEQYKNCKNFLNLCHHQQDFNMDSEWIFFATSHGKLPCDGVGGFVKHYVVKHSLQRSSPPTWPNFELPINACSLCKRKSFHHIFGVSQEEVVNMCAELEGHLAKSKIMPGTRSSHPFVPIYCN